METREERLATWIEHPAEMQNVRTLKGCVLLTSSGGPRCLQATEQRVEPYHIDIEYLTSAGDISNGSCQSDDVWQFKAISFPRLQLGRLKLSMSKPVFQLVQDTWKLHPRTIEVFLSNNGILTEFVSLDRSRHSLLLKVANSRSTGFDCVSVTSDLTSRTTYCLYHHLEDESSVFGTLLATPERCMDPHFFVAALYRSYHDHVEVHRNLIDDAIQGIERQTGLGSPGRLVSKVASTRRPSLDKHPVLEDAKSVLRQLSDCQTDLAILGHVARHSLECGEWLIKPIDESGKHASPGAPGRLAISAVRSIIRREMEYLRSRNAMLLSQVQQMKDRAQSQANLLLGVMTLMDAEYTAAIGMDGKRDSIAMKTLAILGILFLPGTFVATLFSINMFQWGSEENSDQSSLSVSSNMWIYWAITVPLTLATLLIWVLWARNENNKTTKRLMIFRSSPWA